MEMIKYLTQNEYRRVINAILNDHKSLTKKRDLAIICVGEYLALRVSEICGLKKEWYNRASAEMYCKRGKGSNSNVLKIIDPFVLKALNDYIDNINEDMVMSPYFFPSPWNPSVPISRGTITYIIKKYFSLANITDPTLYHPHTLKHTRGQELADMGFDIKEVQFWLGHRSAKNTEIYFQFSQTQKQKLYEKLKNNI